MATPQKKTTTKSTATKTKKTITNQFKELQTYIIDTVMTNDTDLKNAKNEVSGIMQKLYVLILSIGGGNILSTKQLDQIKIKLYDAKVYPDQNGNLFKLGREKIGSNDSNVSAKADDRIKAPDSLRKVFSNLSIAIREQDGDKFGAGLTVSLKANPNYSPDEGESVDDGSSLKSIIQQAKDESKNVWQQTQNRVPQEKSFLFANPEFKDRWKEKDHIWINAYLDHLHQSSLNFEFDSGIESKEEKDRRKVQTEFLKVKPV